VPAPRRNAEPIDSFSWNTTARLGATRSTLKQNDHTSVNAKKWRAKGAPPKDLADIKHKSGFASLVLKTKIVLRVRIYLEGLQLILILNWAPGPARYSYWLDNCLAHSYARKNYKRKLKRKLLYYSLVHLPSNQ